MNKLQEALAARERMRLAKIDEIAACIDPDIVAEAKADPNCSAAEMAYRNAIRKTQEQKAHEAVQEYFKSKGDAATV